MDAPLLGLMGHTHHDDINNLMSQAHTGTEY